MTDENMATKNLRSALDGVHRAGVPGAFAEVRVGKRIWRGAAGVADLETGRPVEPGMRQRVGSVTKTFVSAAVLRQVEAGRLGLDAPIGDYLPHLVPGERGRRITVRMLLNHTSGLAEYLPYAFPSLQELAPGSLDDNRFRRFRPDELIAMGVGAPATGEPGSTPGIYSNTNYLLLGELLEHLTGTPVEQHIARTIIETAGLENTGFPAGPPIVGPHSRMYEALFGAIDPPRDYSVYNMSWVMTGAGLVSTVGDLNRFYRKLLDGEIVSLSSLAEMQRLVPVIAQDGRLIDYGLGLYKTEIPGHGTFWGHDGTVWGALTMSWASADTGRQFSAAMNLVRWHKPDAEGTSHPIDDALATLKREALCGPA
ncbi:serine hydrolase domain-containing protein [Amycolatopsis oliviviridis]|uniref:serine hydrolase domain-containing protein n=1 Tax=Amycolatopsis oliviviridis TaxID=1471590 RepID=UPI001E3B24BE|nr:serine hydrolase domain-containing protein [Amycolatopsis oliviviridis]